jgi:hypothetical protein
MCSRWALDESHQPVSITDISSVSDDHVFGISADGTELHQPGAVINVIMPSVDHQEQQDE